jgi:hypothetical protein
MLISATKLNKQTKPEEEDANLGNKTKQNKQTNKQTKA